MTMLKDTIISAFNYDGTLLKWLKKVEDALQNASASEFRVNKKGNATISFSIVFANGDTLESGDIILQQGESVTGATIRQGHLILTLSNGDELDAGDLGAVTGFSINGSQHLIVTYQNGTTQDLGAIFDGATININTLTSNNDEISTLKPVVEVMSGYSLQYVGENFVPDYIGVTKNGNKLSFAFSGICTTLDPHTGGGYTLLRIKVPSNVGNKLIPHFTTLLASYAVMATKDIEWNTPVLAIIRCVKYSANELQFYLLGNGIDVSSKYYIRLDTTYLLSENLVQ